MQVHQNDVPRTLLMLGCGTARSDHGRRQRGGRLRGAPLERGHRDLPHHAVFGDGRALRRMVGCRAPQRVGAGPHGRGDAVGGRRRRSRARRAAGGVSRDHLYGVAGAPPDGAEHVQDRGGADALRDARGRADARDARALDFRRPLGRHGVPPDRIRDAGVGIRSGGAGLCRNRPCRDPRVAHPVPALLRRVPHVARDREDHSARGRDSARPDSGRPGRGSPRPRADSRPARRPGDGAEPRRVLPGARGGEPLRGRLPRDRPGDDGAIRPPDRTRVPALRLRRPSRGGSGARPHGVGRRGRARDGRLAGRARREGGCPEGPALPAILDRRLRRSSPAVGAQDRGARSHEGAGLGRRAPLPGRGHGAPGSAGQRRHGGTRRTAGGRRPVRALLEGVHSGHDRGSVRGAPKTRSEKPLHRRDRRRRHRHVSSLGPRSRHRARVRGPGGLLRARRRRDREREQEHDQDHRRRDRSQRARLLRLRLEEVGGDDDLPSAVRTRADPILLPDRKGELRRMPSVRVSPSLRRARARGGRRRPPGELSG